MFCATMIVTAGSGSGAILWVAGPLVGVSLGTISTSDRIFLLRLAPPDYRGEFFGLSGLVSRLSSGIEPLIVWGGTLWVLSELTDVASEATASRVAVIALALLCLGGILVLRPLSDAPRRWQ